MSSADAELLHLTVDIWHPSCWTLETTRETDVGLFGHGTTVRESDAAGGFTLYGESRDAIETLTATIQESPLTNALTVVSSSATGAVAALGPATQTVLVEFDPVPSIRRAFTSRGFVHYGPTRHKNGREQRSFLARTDRQTVQRTLDDIETAYDADLELSQLTTISGRNDPGSGSNPRLAESASSGDRLSERQREAFQLARTRGYYEYPRQVTARDLAADLDISKTTFLEHLRKAEAKLLSTIELR